jgi:RimJ/RimL family protein N-acetyltransferase
MVPTSSMPRIVTADAVTSAGALTTRIEWPAWRTIVPALINGTTRLRELRRADASSLLSMLAPTEVSRFIAPPPTTLQGFEEFIHWTHRKRIAGQYVCLGIVPAGFDAAIGIFQLQLAALPIPEWGFAMGSPFWGTGLFVEAAEAVVDFAFRGVGVVERGARAVIENERGNGALRKLGAVCAGIVPAGHVKDGQVLDQFYWILSADAPIRRRVIWEARDLHE